MKELTFGKKAINFYKTIALSDTLLSETEIINPYKIPQVRRYMREFYDNFFSDTKDRIFVFGINPGRFGSGVTGVPFTDPVALQDFCGIPNAFEKRCELSSKFVYAFIEHWGGAKKFYQDFFLTAVSLLGFMRNGVNYNYYDDAELFLLLKPFIIHTIKTQLHFGARTDAAIVFGTGKNQKIFNELNKEYGFFKKVYAVEHPRFIMQYQRKNLTKYLKKYKQIFSQAVS